MITSLDTIAQIKLEIDRVSQRRLALWQALAAGPDAEIRRELKRIDGEIEKLWGAQRQLRAEIRFGDRDVILRRARTEERIERAAA
ncbi:MAG: hypothetical protein ACXVZO_00720 [Gaiellaceae bacterium]